MTQFRGSFFKNIVTAQQGHPEECLASWVVVLVGSTQFQYQAVRSQTFYGVSI
jgi:hypothetical protein